MNMRDVGLGLVFAGMIAIIGNVAYKLMEDASIPPLIRLGIIGIFLGLFILLLSLVRERLSEVEK